MTISKADFNSDDHKTRILLVDDDRAILRLLKIFTDSFGHETASAADGVEAVDLLAQHHYDIVITDVMMPRMDGLQLLEHIQRNYPKIDVIVVTGFSNTISYTDVIRAGASDFISKPFNRDELEAKVNRILRERHTIRELERISTRDSLTDLYNRRYFDIRLWEEMHRANRQEYPLFLAILDVDRFKAYNDTYGHQAGDEILQAIGRLMIRCTRKNVDTNYRYGGDEFAIIIPQTTAQQAAQVGERLVHFYRELGFAATDLSIGIARFIRHSDKSWEEDFADFISRADKAMYQAKAAPDRQVVSDPETPPQAAEPGKSKNHPPLPTISCIYTACKPASGRPWRQRQIKHLCLRIVSGI